MAFRACDASPIGQGFALEHTKRPHPRFKIQDPQLLVKLAETVDPKAGLPDGLFPTANRIPTSYGTRNTRSCENGKGRKITRRRRYPKLPLAQADRSAGHPASA